MSTIYNPESDLTAQIERLELEARDIRRKLQQAHLPEDKRVLERQLKEVEHEVELLKAKLP